MGGLWMSGLHSEWDQLSSQFSSVAEQASASIVAVHGGRRVAASGIIWRPGLIVTASHMLRKSAEIEVSFFNRSRHKTTLLGRDSGTDLALLRLADQAPGTPAEPGDVSRLRVGQIVLAVGRSTAGELAASSGIIARLGSAWQTWRGGSV